MQNYCVSDLSFNGPCRQRQKNNMASPASLVFAGLGKFNVKTIQTPKTSMDLAGLASSRRPRDVQTVTYAMVREARRISFSSIYSNYADIFNHRSMEKDKLFVLDVCGAYGQKDINKLDRSEMNKPARGIS